MKESAQKREELLSSGINDLPIITSPKKAVLSTAVEPLALPNHLKRSAASGRTDLEEER